MRWSPRRGTARSGSAASTISPPGSRPCGSLRHASGGSGWTLPGSRCKAATPRSSCATWWAASPSWGTRSTPTWSGGGSAAPRSRPGGASAGRAARCCTTSRRVPTRPRWRTSGSSTPASPTGPCCVGASRCAPTAAACWRSGSIRSRSRPAAARSRAGSPRSARPIPASSPYGRPTSRRATSISSSPAPSSTGCPWRAASAAAPSPRERSARCTSRRAGGSATPSSRAGRSPRCAVAARWTCRAAPEWASAPSRWTPRRSTWGRGGARGRLDGTVAALATHADLQSEEAGGGVRVDGVLPLLASRLGAGAAPARTRELDLSRWPAAPAAPSSRLSGTLAGTVGADSGAAPAGAVSAAHGPSLFAGAGLDSGVARLRFADRRVDVDSLRLSQPGLITTGSGVLGWARPARGTLSLDLDADSLNSVDSLIAWVAGRALGREGGGGGRSLAGAARVAVTLEGALDSLAVEARASLERLRWREWEVPAGRARVTYRPGPVPAIAGEVTLDSLALGERGFGAATASVAGTRDSLAWFARSRVGQVGAVLAGGRYVRRADAASVAVDSLALQIPGDVWVLRRPVAFVMTDSAARVAGLALESVYGTGRLLLQGDLPTRGRADAHLQIEGFPLAGLYALLQKDTAGVGGTIGATAALAGTRAEPLYTGSFSLTNGSIGEFHAPYVDGSFEYRDRRLESAMPPWRSGQQVLTVRAHLPLDLALAPVERRQLPDTLSVRATADSVDLSLLEALTPLLKEVAGVVSAGRPVDRAWGGARARGGLRGPGAAAPSPPPHAGFAGGSGRRAPPRATNPRERVAGPGGPRP